MPGGTHDLTPDGLWRREAMLEELMEDRDLLPVRFGTRVEDEPAAARLVAARDRELSAGLDRVRGAVELAVRAGAPEPEGARGGLGYMRAKVDRARSAQQLHAPLAALARDAVVQPGPDLLRAAYLIDRDAVDEFVALVRSLQHDHPSVALTCTGPWPPYSFAQDTSRP